MSDLVARLLGVLDRGDRLAPFGPALDLPAAYALQHAVSDARRRRGAQRVGRKIGFTNTTIWPIYHVHAPIWGPVWDTTHHPGAATLALGPLPEPRIEPEIVLRLARAPEAGMNPATLAGCIEAIAPGFEIVQSPYPGWRFRAPDTVAAFALHGALVTGDWTPATPALLAALPGLGATLSRDGTLRATGRGSDVLGGGPLAALAHLAGLLASDPGAPPLEPGEIISTGTLTDALPVAPEQRWHFATNLPGLAPLTLRLVA